jgi:hypothetical protein
MMHRCDDSHGPTPWGRLSLEIADTAPSLVHGGRLTSHHVYYQLGDTAG